MIEGPLTYTLQANEIVKYGPVDHIKMIVGHYCIIENPVQRDTDGKIIYDELGQVSCSILYLYIIRPS
jgi:hypothetical protein